MANDRSFFNLPRFTKGAKLLDQLTADKLNAICDAIKACRLQDGKFSKARRSAEGQSVDILPPTDTSSDDTADVWIPFPTPYTGDPAPDQAFHISIVPGLLNNRVASNKSIDITVPANLTPTDEDSDGYCVYLNVGLAVPGIDIVTSVEYTAQAGFPTPIVYPPNVSPSTANIILFKVYSDANGVTWDDTEQYISRSLNAFATTAAIDCDTVTYGFGLNGL